MLLFVHDPREEDELAAAFVSGLRDLGAEVRLAAMDRRAPEAENAAVLATRLHAHMVVGGFSWAARLAASASAEVSESVTHKLLCLGFPFHPRGAPEDTSRLALLEAAPETLILQGERDAHGNRAWVRGRKLPARARVEWIADGNHRFEPRASSGATREANLRRVVETAAAFCR